MNQRSLARYPFVLLVIHATGCFLEDTTTITKLNDQAASPAAPTGPAAPASMPTAMPTAADNTPVTRTPDAPVSTGQAAGMAAPAAAESSAAGTGAAGSSAGGSAAASAGSGAAGSSGDVPAAGSGGAAPAAGSGAVPAAGGGAVAGAGSPAAGTGGALEPGALQCPMEVCAPLPPLPMGAPASFKIENCCAASGDCGTSLNGGACNRTADSAPDCEPLMTMGFTVPSCCTPMGRCGIDGSSFMRGCMSLDDLAAQAGAFGIEVPAPKACTPAM
ncbi:MAG TPA: hypothetical protein VJR89_11580 [Polyangiales bacterium]|nr:hypothetical protein [Polyangiales bacterium]